MIKILALAGILLSSYFIWVRHKAEDKNYRAICDINEKMSCTRAARSKYGNILIISNAVFGLIYYSAALLLSYMQQEKIIFFLSVPALMFTVFLIYISYFRIKVYCPVCHLTYLINIVIFIMTYPV